MRQLLLLNFWYSKKRLKTPQHYQTSDFINFQKRCKTFASLRNFTNVSTEVWDSSSRCRGGSIGMRLLKRHEKCLRRNFFSDGQTQRICNTEGPALPCSHCGGSSRQIGKLSKVCVTDPQTTKHYFSLSRFVGWALAFSQYWLDQM